MDAVYFAIIGINQNIAVCQDKILLYAPLQKTQTASRSKRLCFFYKPNIICLINIIKIGLYHGSFMVHDHIILTAAIF